MNHLSASSSLGRSLPLPDPPGNIRGGLLSGIQLGVPRHGRDVLAVAVREHLQPLDLARARGPRLLLHGPVRLALELPHDLVVLPEPAPFLGVPVPVDGLGLRVRVELDQGVVQRVRAPPPLLLGADHAGDLAARVALHLHLRRRRRPLHPVDRERVLLARRRRC